MDGDIAQLARAAALQAVGQGFESPYLHTHGAVRGGLRRRLTGIGKGNARKRRLECQRKGRFKVCRVFQRFTGLLDGHLSWRSLRESEKDNMVKRIEVYGGCLGAVRRRRP